MIVKTFLTSLSLLISCTSSQPGGGASIQEKKEPAMTKYEMIAVEKFKGHIDYVFNETKTHVLCSHSDKANAMNPRRTVSFFIYDLTKDTVLYEDAVGDGSVKWKNDHQVEILTKIGVITPGHQSNIIRTLYDLHLQKKISGDIEEKKDN